MHPLILLAILGSQPASPAEGALTAGAAAVRAPPTRAEARRVALSMSAGAVVGRPVLELEVAPIDHLAVYVQGELGLAAGLGYGVQGGVRLRPMRGLLGPFLDLHVRHAQFVMLTNAVTEALSPGVLVGGSYVSEGGFLLSAGIGLSLLAETTETRWRTQAVSGPVVSFGVPTASTTTTLGPVPELRLQLGYAF